MNRVSLVGRLTRDPDYRQGDSSVVRFTIAVDRKYKNKEGRYDADFINCVAFKSSADFIAKYFTKGMRIGIDGHIQTGSYTNKDGQKIYTFEVVVDGSEFVESKSSAPAQDGFTAPMTSTDGFVDVGNGFMDIPSGIQEELPFQ